MTLVNWLELKAPYPILVTLFPAMVFGITRSVGHVPEQPVTVTLSPLSSYSKPLVASKGNVSKSSVTPSPSVSAKIGLVPAEASAVSEIPSLSSSKSALLPTPS